MDEISITKKMATSELTSFPVGLDKERPLIHADATSEHGSTEQTRRHRRKQGKLAWEINCLDPLVFCF